MSWADSHCHLQHPKVAGPGVFPVSLPLADAANARVRRIICVGYDHASSIEAIATAEDAQTLTNGDIEVWATVGLHPHDAKNGWAWIPDLLASAPGNRVVAVGECGLDYYYDHSPRPDQRASFAAQIGFALAYKRPLVIHTRDAWEDTFAILLAEGVPDRTVFHCFTGGPAQAERALELGGFISYSGIVTFKNATDVQDAARLTPLDRLLVETDAPYLAPVPHRGRTNSPGYLPLVGRAIADLKGVDPDVIEQSTWNTCSDAFALFQAQSVLWADHVSRGLREEQEALARAADPLRDNE